VLHGVSSDSKLSHPDLHVTYTQAQVKQRTVTKINNLGPEVTLGVHNGDIRTLKTALLERMYYCKVGTGYEAAPKIAYKFIHKRLSYFKRLVSRFHARPSTMDEVVAMYVGRKKTIYEQAAEEYRRRGLRREDAYICAFVKVEKVNTGKAPRCIQPRKPVYNVRVGKYIKKIEHRLYREIAKIYGHGPVVMKGYTTQQVAGIIHDKWNRLAKPVAVGLDATKFDMHVCEGMLEWEHSIYEAIYRNLGTETQELKRMLRWQRENVGRGRCEDGTLKFKVKGKRASGDMNTALGNCLIMCALVHAYAKERGVEVDLANNGDDCVVFLEMDQLNTFMEGLSKWFLEMGFRMTVEPPVYEMEHIEFCQMHPVPTGQGWNMVRNIKTALQKDTMCTIPLNGQSARKWMYSVGECGMAICSGVPVMQEFYAAYVRNGNPNSKIGNSLNMQTGLRMMRGNMVSKWSQVTDEARLGVYTAWDITPDEQIALEEHYKQWTFTGQADIINTHTTPHITNVL